MECVLYEDMEEIKKSLNDVSDELSKMVEKQDLMSLIDEVQQRIEVLERRLDDLEKCTRMDELVASGLVTSRRSYARNTARDKEGECNSPAPSGELHSLEQQVIKLFYSKDTPRDDTNIEACYLVRSLSDFG